MLKFPGKLIPSERMIEIFREQHNRADYLNLSFFEKPYFCYQNNCTINCLTMNIIEKINEDLKTAMRSKDKIALEALRAAKTAFTLAKTQEGSKELSEADELKIIQKLVKQRNDSAAIYNEQSRDDLYQKEIAEAKVLEQYLPAKMTADELTSYLKKLIERTGASGPQDMGKVMGVATKELAGKADGKEISIIVRGLLTQ